VDDVVQLIGEARTAKTCVRIQGAEHSLLVTIHVHQRHAHQPGQAQQAAHRGHSQQTPYRTGGHSHQRPRAILAKDNLGMRNLGSIMEQSLPTPSPPAPTGRAYAWATSPRKLLGLRS
jgi:hypothetical protein